MLEVGTSNMLDLAGAEFAWGRLEPHFDQPSRVWQIQTIQLGRIFDVRHAFEVVPEVTPEHCYLLVLRVYRFSE